MTVLFGTVEYFEREIRDYLSSNQINSSIVAEEISQIQTKLENEILYDFICDERIRVECLQNLTYACDRLADYYGAN
ncbi:hypothetical protein [Bacillus sp. T33-2]|uniref:hypothetical protein n=1 Tax=Bacillus sp. T33-2 TaxID=2054168 RepID=UPI000C77BA0A|nr:hypothetical protein [Bacillus sp. T33-2]PLR96810.1 hypothetical protein CVD19_10620 [Bacillus sp. T33-2]